MSACACACSCVELMSGSVSRVTHGVTRAAVEVLRERERCFWGKLQTGWDSGPMPARQGSRDPFADRLAPGHASMLTQGDDERDEAAYLAAVTSPIVCSAGNRASGAGVERLGSVVTRGTPERECCLWQRDDGEEHPFVLLHRRFSVLHLLVQRWKKRTAFSAVMLKGSACCFRACDCTHLQ